MLLWLKSFRAAIGPKCNCFYKVEFLLFLWSDFREENVRCKLKTLLLTWCRVQTFVYKLRVQTLHVVYKLLRYTCIFLPKKSNFSKDVNFLTGDLLTTTDFCWKCAMVHFKLRALPFRWYIALSAATKTNAMRLNQNFEKSVQYFF